MVLFVDFERPCKAPVSWLNKLLLAFAPLTPELQQAKANHEKWERDYYATPAAPHTTVAPGTDASTIGSAPPMAHTDSHQAKTTTDERAHG